MWPAEISHTSPKASRGAVSVTVVMKSSMERGRPARSCCPKGAGGTPALHSAIAIRVQASLLQRAHASCYVRLAPPDASFHASPFSRAGVSHGCDTTKLRPGGERRDHRQ